MDSSRNDKSSAIVRLVIWSIVAVVLIGILCSTLIFNKGWGVLDYGISIGGTNISFFGSYAYDDPDTYSVGNAAYTEKIKNINIHWSAGSVTLNVWEGDEIKVTESGNIKNDADRMRTRVEGDTLDIHYARSGGRWGFSSPSKQLTVSIPKTIAAELLDVCINTASADILISDSSDIGNSINCRRLDLVCVSGRMEILGVKALKAELCGVSSDIVFRGNADELSVEEVSGSLSLSGEIGELCVESISGKVSLNFDNAPRRVKVDTVSGNTNISLPQSDDGFEASLDSLSGSIRVDGKFVGKYYRHGKAAAELDFDSVSGSVSIDIIPSE